MVRRRHKTMLDRLADVHGSSGSDGYSVVEDTIRRRQTEERLKGSLDALVAVHEAGRVLTSALSPEEIGVRLVEIVQRVSSLEAAVVDLRDEHEQSCVLHAHGSEDLWRPASATPEARTARREAMESKGPRSFRLGPRTGGGAPLVGLCLPLVVRDRPAGVLEVYGPESLTEEVTVEALESISRQAASALENARLHRMLAEREHRLQDFAGRLLEARKEERRRIACDLHDGLIQAAVTAHQDLQACAGDYPPGSPSGREKLDRALELVGQIVEEVRDVITTLRPKALDGSGLGAMLRSRVDSLRVEGWEITYAEALGEERLPAEVETTLYWVAREALTNVRKHARTTRANVTLRRSGKGVCLKVHDLGCGFDGAAPRASRGPGEQVGLFGMRERISLLGGEFRVDSQAGAGTCVVAEIPFGRTTPTPEDRVPNPSRKASPARLLVADDHALIREGLRATLAGEPDLEVVAEAADGREAIELSRGLRPDLVLMDVRMPEMDGLAVARAIKAESIGTDVLMLTAHGDPDDLFEAVQAGAVGYVIKDADKRELIGAVRGALCGRSPLNPELAMRLLRNLAGEDGRATGFSSENGKRPEPHPEALTPRELEILRLVAQGQTNRQISRKLVVSPATVKVHVEHILSKLGASDRTQAAVRASEAGLLDPGG